MKKIYLILSLIVAGTFFSCSNEGDEPVVRKSSLASISAFSLDFQGVKEGGVLTEGLGSENITISVPFGTSLTAKTNIKVSKGATVEPKSGTEVTFEEGKAKDFVVTAEDGTKKTYKVTVKVRPEVGSGTKLKSIIITDKYNNVEKHTYTYNDMNFVATYKYKSKWEPEVVYTYKYNDKNQIIEKSSEKNTTTYKYENGLIISAEEKSKENDKVTFTYNYTYENKNLIKIERTNVKEGKVDFIQDYKYDDKGNTNYHRAGSDWALFNLEFDDKNNPIKGIFPKAYNKINVGHSVANYNVNNILKIGESVYKYIYNKSNYPQSISYEEWAEPVKVEYEYFN